MNYPLFLARRLSLGASERKSSPAVKVAVVAVSLSIAVMLAAIAIVTGFKKEIRDKVIGINSDMIVYADGRNTDNIVTLSESLRRTLDAVPYIEGYYLEASVPGILKTPEDFKGIYFKGVSEDATLPFIRKSLTSGRMPKLEGVSDEILISDLAASQLGLKAGDEIDTYFISDDVKVRKLKITGTYNSHFDNHDDLYIYGSIGVVQSLSSLGNGQGTAIHIDTGRFDTLEEDSSQLQKYLDQAVDKGDIFKYLTVENAKNLGAVYFNWLSLLDTNVAVILILMTVVACITLVSGILIIILDKMRFIGIMKALGAPNGKVGQIFIWLALKISLIGIVIGNVVMLTLLKIQEATHFIPLDPETYYIGFVPVNLNPLQIIGFNVAVFAVIALVLIVPSRFVARISPDKTMRYE